MDSIQIAQLLLALALGIALSASCGFRVFIPLLVVAIAAKAGLVQLSGDFYWISTWPAIATFAIATIVEILAYYIPAVDNLLDTISVPAAAIAGTVLTASLLTVDVSPLVRWSLSIIAGGGSSALVTAGTAAVRGISTTTTAGLGNHIVASLEAVFATGLSVISVFLPLVGFILALAVLVVGVVAISRFRKRRRAKTVK